MSDIMKYAERDIALLHTERDFALSRTESEGGYAFTRRIPTLKEHAQNLYETAMLARTEIDVYAFQAKFAQLAGGEEMQMR